jgi:hypothetical protein
MLNIASFTASVVASVDCLILYGLVLYGLVLYGLFLYSLYRIRESFRHPSHRLLRGSVVISPLALRAAASTSRH